MALPAAHIDRLALRIRHQIQARHSAPRLPLTMPGSLITRLVLPAAPLPPAAPAPAAQINEMRNGMDFIPRTSRRREVYTATMSHRLLRHRLAVSLAKMKYGKANRDSPLLANIYLHYALDLWAARCRGVRPRAI
jgi:hypothetical protein